MRRLFMAVCAVLMFSQAQADETLSAADTSAIQSVIQDQLDAFNRDDGVRAFSHASPSIQGIFQTVDVFMGMVRDGYLPIYRSAQAEFGALQMMNGEPVQEVYVTGQDGISVLAVYTMEQQEDGSWRINGCTILKAPDLTA
jgi:hypothetical protein